MKKKIKSHTNRHSPNDPRKIADVLTDLFAQRGYAQIKAVDDCQEAWAHIVGDLKSCSHAGEVKRGVLQVMVSNSVIMQELTFRQEELVTELQRMLPQHRIKSLRFRVGSVA